MAKARATCTCATCGATFEVEKICYNRQQADSWAEYAVRTYVECDNCAAERRAREAEVIKQQAAESGLPEIISGTPKQVNWAVTLRSQFCERYAELARKHSKAQGFAVFTDIYQWVLHNKVSARWWIDHREGASSATGLHSVLLDERKEYEDAQTALKRQEELTAEAAQPAVSEAMLRPEEDTGKAAAEIRTSPERVESGYARDESFIAACKACGFKWDSAKRVWYTSIGARSGRWQDRAAELGNALLRAGIPVIIWDADVREMAANATFAPRTDRWIAVDEDGGLVVYWERGNSKLYQVARSLPGARYHSGKVLVPVAQWRAVRDLAASWEFGITDAARIAMDARREAEARALTVNPGKPKTSKPNNGGLSNLMDSTSSVLSDLRDD